MILLLLGKGPVCAITWKQGAQCWERYARIPEVTPGENIASHLTSAQTRSFLTGQTLVHSKGGMGPQSAAETGLFPVPSCALEEMAYFVESVS